MLHPGIVVTHLTRHEAKLRIRACLAAGRTIFVRHALKELEKDSMTTGDALNVLRGGVVSEPEFENRAWRYRVSTRQMVVIVEIQGAPDAEKIVVVTAWRIRP